MAKVAKLVIVTNKHTMDVVDNLFLSEVKEDEAIYYRRRVKNCANL